MSETDITELSIHLRTGERGEALAAQYLEQLGWRIEARNFKVKIGEIDIVATRPLEDGEMVAIVEVKSRQAGSRSRSPLALSVTADKRGKITRAARLYDEMNGRAKRHYRFDVITVDFNEDPPKIIHFKGAFDANGKPY